ncbi:MAG: prephenate dehydrogenase/arogenate dehydrogenase family protein [Brachymonas sp.]|nr:prephenate dehydrogenase/arogenate dehydrogenase family protein [Brachymonas sp.]
MFNRLALIGCGLMGGSLALAMQRARLVRHIVAYAPQAHTLQTAQQMGVIHAAASCPADAVAHADLVVLAVPVAASESVFLGMANSLPEQAIVMDVGSTKQNVIEAAEAALGTRVGQFVPAHPIAGKEVAGIAHADADLYRGKQVILTPTRLTRIGALQQITALWEALGCKVQTMTPQAHDAAFAAISHLPHLTAFALMHSILHQDAATDTLALGGSGFRDFTRIAASDPAMWRDIFLCNREEILLQTDLLIDALHTFARAMEAHNGEQLHALVTQASEARSQWRMTTKDENARL